MTHTLFLLVDGFLAEFPPVVLQDIEFFLDPSTVHGEFRKETINKEK
jgi:hypothetical protein